MTDTVPIDTNTAPVEQATEAMKASTEALVSHKDAAEEASKATKLHNEEIGKSTSIYGAVTSAAKKHSEVLGLLATAALGGKDHFAYLNKELDATKFNGITDQIKRLGDNLSLDQIKGLGKSLGMADSAIATFAKGGIKTLIDEVLNFSQASDSVAKFEQGMFETAARTGKLGKAYDEVGGDIAKFSTRVVEHQKMITDAARSAHLDPVAAQDYYKALRLIPGALEEMQISSGSTTSQMSMLEATMHLTRGTGMGLEEVSRHLKTAFENYNLTGEDSLEFTAKISELSQKLQIPLHDVSEYVTRLADNFGMLGDQSKGTANILANTFQSFKDSGLSAKQSVSIIQGMTESVLNLNVAQRSFLSAQTGGPGGLVGSFKMLKDLRDGKVDDVFDKVKQQMTRQMGPIVSLDQAATSSSAAAMRLKQMSILQQGPLGKFAKDEATANRILDAFSKNTPGTKLDTKQFMEQTMSRAKELEGKTAVPLLEDANQKLAEIAINTAANTHQVVTGNITTFRKEDKGAIEAGERASKYAKAKGSERMDRDDVKAGFGKSAIDLAHLVSTLPGELGKAKDSVASSLTKDTATMKEKNKFNEEKKLKVDPILAKSDTKQKIITTDGETRGYISDMSRRQIDRSMSSPDRKAPTLTGKIDSATRAVSAAAESKTDKKAVDKKDKTEKSDSTLTVKVTGVCLDCGRETSSEHLHATTGHK